jgi:preprotein translocase subunit Sec63
MLSASLRGCYELLGLTNGCSELEIKSAYKRLALLHHPDKNRGSKRSEERFKLVCLPLLASHMVRFDFKKYADVKD